jgi:hypothetical protein
VSRIEGQDIRPIVQAIVPTYHYNLKSDQSGPIDE